MGAVAKTFDRVIPNEIKPIVPVAAAMFGAPFLAGSSLLGGIGSVALRQGLASGLTAAGTQALMGQKIDPRTVGASALFGGLGTGLRGLEGTGKLATAGRRVGQILAPTTYTPGEGFALTGTGEGLSALTQPLTVAATTGGTISAMDAAEEARKEYEATLGEGQEADTEERRNYISRYMGLAGFSQDEINDALSRYGYAKGGRVGFAEGGSSLFEKASDMNRLALEIKLIDLGYGGFGGKDLEDMTDEQIIQLYKEATSKAKGGLMGTRVGYEMGGMSDLGKLFSKITGKKPTEESLMDLKSRYAKEIENQMIGELEDDYPAMETLIQIRNEANRQADMALSDYMKSLGMEPFNPPEGSMSDKLINQIMEPRKEGRVEEANGGRINFAGGGYTPIDYYDELNYKDYLEKLEEGLVPIDETTGKPMSYEDYEQDRAEGMMAKGGRVNFAEGGSSTEQQKRENYFDLKRDEFMSLSEYLLSPMSDADLRSGKADGGRIGYKIGGNVIKLFTFDNGFDRGLFESMYDEYLEDNEGKGLYNYAIDWLGSIGSFGDNYKNGGRAGYAQGGLEERGKIYSGYLDKLEKKIKDPNLSSDEAKTIMDQLKEIRKMISVGKKDGGIMNLKMGGMPMEMDLRGGGFVPIGAKEKADDVPARLSKNEFVFTADAVRAAGGGSVNKGAQKMYDLMNSLEAKV